MFLLIDNYDSFTYNLYALFRNSNIDVCIIKNTDYFMDASRFKGIIFSPGPSCPSNSGATLKYINEYLGKKPILGVCLGMQAIGVALGFNVKHAKSVQHGKVDEIKISKRKVLFRKLNDFKAVRYHSLAVNIPDNHSFVTATAKSDNEVMAIEDSDKKFFGVQFHPESFLSENGEILIKNFIDFANGG